MKNPSKVERAKEGSRLLRGSLSETLAGPDEGFGPEDIQVLKFHGVYQQDDRDQRVTRRKAGLDKEYEFMARLRLPGGRLSSAQWLAIDAAERRLGRGRGLRLTSRQAVQFHGLAQGELAPLLRELDQAFLTTLGACGDVGRNVMVTPAPIADEVHRAAWEVATAIAARLELRTGSYREIWIEGVRTPELDAETEHEPLYGSTYLPRKFKVGVTVAGENEIDVFTHDVGLVVVDGPGGERGVSIVVGGGLGLTHRRADTFARLATPLGWVPLASAADVVAAVAEVFRDAGDRSDRRHARLKYLLEEWGTDRFRDAVEERLERSLGTWIAPGSFGPQELLGVREQGDGRYFLGLSVPNGRLLDGPRGLRAALAEIAREIAPRWIVTPTQNLLAADLEEAELAEVQRRLQPYGVPDPNELSRLQRFAIACPALPTCGLALTDAERVLPEVAAALDGLLADEGLSKVPLAVRMTGCPNGCARPYSADIGLVGRSPGHYDLYVGGGLAGDRLAELYEEKVPRGEIVSVLRPLIQAWNRSRAARRNDESLGSFYWRLRPEGPSRVLRRGDKNPTRALLAPILNQYRVPVAPKKGTTTMSQTTLETAANRLPRIGDTAPDFTAQTTHGPLTFSDWQGQDWVVLFSHPADFTPVCTTELAAFARRQEEFSQRQVRLIGLSIDSVHAHLAWVENIRESLGVEVDYPLVADLDQAVARRWGLLHPGESETATVRALFVVDPARTVRAIIYYPLNVGRNVDEVLRLVDALQLATEQSVALPVDWQPGAEVVVPPPKTLEDVASRRGTSDRVHTFYLHTRSLGGGEEASGVASGPGTDS